MTFRGDHGIVFCFGCDIGKVILFRVLFRFLLFVALGALFAAENVGFPFNRRCVCR